MVPSHHSHYMMTIIFPGKTPDPSLTWGRPMALLTWAGLSLQPGRCVPLALPVNAGLPDHPSCTAWEGSHSRKDPWGWGQQWSAL